MNNTDQQKILQAEVLLARYSNALREILKLQGGDPFPSEKLIDPEEASRLIRFRIIKSGDEHPRKIRMALEDPIATFDLLSRAHSEPRAGNA